MLEPGTRAPDFTAETADGKIIRSSDFRGKTLVLYFFPKAFTPGWTLEATRFRDAYPDIQKLGGEVLGVSTDDKKTQADFARSLGVEFPMIGDPDKKVSRAFGVLWPILGRDRRVTFVIDQVGLIRAVYNHELQIGRHLEDAIEMLTDLHKLGEKKS